MKHTHEVLTTTNYGLFKTISANRHLDQAHVARLVKSMEKEYLPVPILVNSKHEVIDGQHRLQALKQLDLPVFYIKGNGFGIEEVQILNTNAKNWTVEDFAKSYAQSGNKNYQMFLEFIAIYALDYYTCMSILSRGKDTKGANNTGGHTTIKFKSGKFVVTSLDTAHRMAKKVMDIKPFFNGYKKAGFVKAFLPITENSAYNHKHFLGKLEHNSTRLVPCATIDQYKRLIESIYNWKSKDKVRFF